MKDHDSRKINWHTGLRGEEQREEENNLTRARKQKVPQGLFKVVDRWSWVPLVPSPSLIRASVVSELPCCPAASTVTSLAGCGPGCS
jgi:hypothetical protein